MNAEAREVLTYVQISSLDTFGDLPGAVEHVGDLYFRAWQPQGLCSSVEEAREIVGAIHPANTTVALGPQDTFVGALHHLNVQASDPADLYGKLSTRRSVLTLAGKDPRSLQIAANVRPCFSIAVP